MRNHTKSLLTSWSLGALAAMVLLGALYIATLEEERVRVIEAIEQSATHAQQRSQQLRERGARAICREHHASAVPQWDDNGVLDCITTAQGNQP